MAVRAVPFTQPKLSLPDSIITSSLPSASLDSRNSNTSNVSRRRLGLVALVSSIVSAPNPIASSVGLDLRIAVPDPNQTIEEAKSAIRDHAEALLSVKSLLESESWREAQNALRRSSPKLKQDIHTIIESKPPAERPALRKLYSILFNNVTQLDYAAREKNASRVRLCYDNIEEAIHDILERV